MECVESSAMLPLRVGGGVGWAVGVARAQAGRGGREQGGAVSGWLYNCMCVCIRLPVAFQRMDERRRWRRWRRWERRAKGAIER